MKKVLSCFLIIIFTLTGCTNFSDKEAGWNLYDAIINGNLQAVKDILKDKEVDLEKLPVEEVTDLCENESRALGYALDETNDLPMRVEIVRYLIEKGADIESKGDNGITYVSYVTGGNMDKLSLLLEAGADPNVKDDNGYSAMEHSVSKMNDRPYKWKEIELLMQYGGKITDKTLQVYMENSGYLFGKRIVEHLRSKGAETGLKKDIEYAVCGESEKLLDYIKHNKISDKDAVIKYAAANCNVETIRQLRKSGCSLDVEEDTCDGWMNLLSIVARYNKDEKVVEYLLKEGIDPENDDPQGDTYNALTLAAIGGKAKNIEVLKKSGVKWQRDDMSMAETWLAVCEKGNEQSVQVLLDSGFQPTDRECAEGYSYANEDTIQAMFENDVPYNGKYEEEGVEYDGFAEMCYMNPKWAFELYKMKKDIKLTREAQENIFMNYDTDFIRYLIEQDKRTSHFFLERSLDAAVSNGDLEMVKYLVEKGADPNSKIREEEDYFYTVMHTAAANDSKTILDYLIQNGGDMKVKDSDGDTPEDVREMMEEEMLYI